MGGIGPGEDFMFRKGFLRGIIPGKTEKAIRFLQSGGFLVPCGLTGRACRGKRREIFPGGRAKGTVGDAREPFWRRPEAGARRGVQISEKYFFKMLAI